MYRRILFLFLFTTIFIVNVLSQITLLGKVVDKQDNQIIFANILLKNMTDKNIVYQTITDARGEYEFNNIVAGRYLITISSLGYKTYIKERLFFLPSNGNILKRNFTLTENVQELKEVRVNAYAKQNIDHRNYVFNDKEIKNCSHAKELLSKIPELTEDPNSGTLKKTLGFGSIIVLINGIKSSQLQLRTIPPEKVKRIVFYDMPPARYAGISAVVDVITSPLESGFVLGTDVQHSFSTGFSNDMIYSLYSYGKHLFEVNYKLNYRNYKERQTSKSFQYYLDNSLYEDKLSILDDFGYTTHTTELKYSYIKSPRHILQISLLPNFEKSWSSGSASGTFIKNKLKANIRQKQKQNSDVFHPALDIYYQNKLGKGNLYSNVRTTFFKINSYEDILKTDVKTKDILINDEMNLRNYKFSLLGELSYTLPLAWVSLSSGVISEYAKMNSEINNYLGDFSYTSEYGKNYFYSELKGSYNKFSYRLSLGLNHLFFENQLNKYGKFTITPNMLLSYNIDAHNQVRLNYQLTPRLPNLNHLSNNAIRLSNNIVRRGNPLLKEALEHSILGLYNYNSKYLDIISGLYFSYTKRPFCSNFQDKETHYEFLTFNGKLAREYAALIMLNYRPWGDSRLTITGQIAPQKKAIYLANSSYQLECWENSLLISYKRENWQANYRVNIPVYKLNNGFEDLEENIHDLSISYKWKNLQLKSSILFIGSPAHYNTRSLPMSLVNYSSDTNIYANKNMITLGISYHFRSGKDKTFNRKLNNKDSVKPIF